MEDDVKILELIFCIFSHFFGSIYNIFSPNIYFMERNFISSLTTLVWRDFF